MVVSNPRSQKTSKGKLLLSVGSGVLVGSVLTAFVVFIIQSRSPKPTYAMHVPPPSFSTPVQASELLGPADVSGSVEAEAVWDDFVPDSTPIKNPPQVVTTGGLSDQLPPPSLPSTFDNSPQASSSAGLGFSTQASTPQAFGQTVIGPSIAPGNVAAGPSGDLSGSGGHAWTPSNLAQKLRALPRDKRDEDEVSKLRDMLGDEFDERQEKQKDEVKKVLEEAAKSEKILAEREENRDSIIQNRMRALLGEIGPMDWEYRPQYPIQNSPSSLGAPAVRYYSTNRM